MHETFPGEPVASLGDVARRVDSGHRCLEIVVHVNAPLGDNPGSAKEFNMRLDAGGGHDQVSFQHPSVVQSHAGHARRADEGLRLNAEQELHAAMGEPLLGDGGRGGIEDPRHDPRASANDSDVNSEIGEQE